MAVAGIVAGGSGMRMGTELPKQFMELCSKPVIIRTTEAFLKSGEITSVIIGINPDWYDYMQKLLEKYSLDRVYLTKGGSDRNETLMNIINYARKELSAKDDEIILTHDAVRPFVSERMIKDSIIALEEYDIVTAAVAATDTIIVSEDGQTASDFPLRSTMYQVQTPQSFRIGSFERVYSSVSPEEKAAVTDACKLFHLNGHRVGIISGERNNIKLTYPSDIITAKAICETEENK